MEIVWFLQKTIIMGILAPHPFYTVNNDLVQLLGFSITASWKTPPPQKKKNSRYCAWGKIGMLAKERDRTLTFFLYSLPNEEEYIKERIGNKSKEH